VKPGPNEHWLIPLLLAVAVLAGLLNILTFKSNKQQCEEACAPWEAIDAHDNSCKCAPFAEKSSEWFRKVR
jgi:hypothetical protein